MRAAYAARAGNDIDDIYTYRSSHHSREVADRIERALREAVKVGLVAKLAGHANPTITLGHYTQAVRGGTQAIDRLERMYRGEPGGPPMPSSGMGQ
jgi:plasmid stabilization system protein ParE